MSYTKLTETQTAIHLQLPKVSVDDSAINACPKTFTGVENDLEESSTDEEDQPDLLEELPETSVENDGKNVLDILEVLLSLKSAAWARRKVAINSITSATNAKKIHTDSSMQTGSTSSNKKETFTRKCCSQKKEIPCKTSKSVSSLITATETTHSFQPETELPSTHATLSHIISYDTSGGREAVKMHSINLYQAILPSSIFKNSEKNSMKKF